MLCSSVCLYAPNLFQFHLLIFTFKIFALFGCYHPYLYIFNTSLILILQFFNIYCQILKIISNNRLFSFRIVCLLYGLKVGVLIKTRCHHKKLQFQLKKLPDHLYLMNYRIRETHHM